MTSLIFDLGSTLIYFNGDWPALRVQANRALEESLIASGVALNEGFAERFGQRVQHYYNERDTAYVEQTSLSLLIGQLEEEGIPMLPTSILTEALRCMFAVSEARWVIEHDTISTLEALRSRGYRMAILSNAGDNDNVQRLVDKAGIREFFSSIQVSANLGIRKPNPRALHSAMDALGSRPEETVMIGDLLGADILGARFAGCRSVWITRRAKNSQNESLQGQIEADANIAALHELPPLLEDWNRVSANQ